MKGKKTSITEPAKIILKVLKKQNITDASFGIIVSVKNRKDHVNSVKITELSGCHLITTTGKMYKQEIRIYDNVSPEVITDVLKKGLNESFRIL